MRFPSGPVSPMDDHNQPFEDRHPSRDSTPDILAEDGASSPTSVYKSRHISLQRRVDSTAATPVYSGEEDHSVPDLPSQYKRSRSRSFLIEQYRKEQEQHYPAFPNEYPDSLGPPPETSTMEPHHNIIMPPQAIKMSTLHEIMFVGVVAVSHFMTQAGLGQALVPLDLVAQSFDIANPGESSWFVAGYSLTVGTFILISGRLGDILGHKRMFVFGYAWFGVWSAFAGFAAYPGHQIFFDMCRAMQGIGPALIMPNGLALFGRAYPPGIKKNIVFSIFGAVAPAGFVVGSTFGSLFAQLEWWPWAFWSFAVVCWCLCVFALLVVPKELSERPLVSPGFDFTGSFLGVSGLVLFNVAWNNGPLFGWNTPHVYFTLIVGFLCLVAFIWVEKRAENPILPLHAMTASVNFVLACVGLGWGAFGVWVFYVFRFLELIRHSTPLSSAAQFSPAVICGLLAAGMTGFMLTHTPVSFVMFVSMCAFAIGIIVAATQPAIQTYWAQMFVSIVIMPFGMDMSFPAASVILSNHMPPEHQGLAMSLVNTVVNYFISISLGIAGTVEVATVRGLDLNDPEVQIKGIRSAFYTAIGLSLAGVACGAMFFIKEYRAHGWKVMEH